MGQTPPVDVRAVLLLACACAAIYLMMSAALDLIQVEADAEAAVQRADVAAWEVSRLLQEAREITEQAAIGGEGM